MSLSPSVWTGVALLAIGLVQAAWTLLISPARLTRDLAGTLENQIDRKKKRDSIAATAFLILTAAFSIWNIKDSFMNEPATKKEFSALEERVTKLEKGPPPGWTEGIFKRLDAIDASLASAGQLTKGMVSAEDLKRTRTELERLIKKVAAETQSLRTQVLQRGQAQGG